MPMLSDRDISVAGFAMGLAGLFLPKSPQPVPIPPAAPVTPSYGGSNANLIMRTTFEQMLPFATADHLWTNHHRENFPNNFIPLTAWGKQTIYNEPYNALGMRIYSEVTSVDVELIEFYLYFFDKLGSVWVILDSIGISPITLNEVDTGLIPISAAGIPGKVIVNPNFDQVSTAILYTNTVDSGVVPVVKGYCEIYGGNV